MILFILALTRHTCSAVVSARKTRETWNRNFLFYLAFLSFRPLIRFAPKTNVDSFNILVLLLLGRDYLEIESAHTRIWGLIWPRRASIWFLVWSTPRFRRLVVVLLYTKRDSLQWVRWRINLVCFNTFFSSLVSERVHDFASSFTGSALCSWSSR